MALMKERFHYSPPLSQFDNNAKQSGGRQARWATSWEAES